MSGALCTLLTCHRLLDALQAELALQLPGHLDRLCAWLSGPNVGELRTLLVELCLTLPVGLGAPLIPLLPRMVRPLLSALTHVGGNATTGN